MATRTGKEKAAEKQIPGNDLKLQSPGRAYPLKESLSEKVADLEADPKRWVEVLETEAAELDLETRVSALDNFMCVEIFRRKANSIHILGYFLFRGDRSSGSMEVRAARGCNEFGEEVCRSTLTDAIPIDKVLDALNGMVNRGASDLQATRASPTAPCCYRHWVRGSSACAASRTAPKKSLDNVLGEAVGALGFVKDIVELYLDKNKGGEE
jgi:hypothetical protein